MCQVDMGVRVIFQVTDTSTSAWDAVVAVLRAVDASHISPPQPELPGVGTAVLPDRETAEQVVHRLLESPVISNAELDAMSWDYAEPSAADPPYEDDVEHDDALGE